jgi:hypothetical protein
MTSNITVGCAEPTAPRGVDASRETHGVALVAGDMSHFVRYNVKAIERIARREL